jgi:Co/Zn/Cd efflux system component
MAVPAAHTDLNKPHPNSARHLHWVAGRFNAQPSASILDGVSQSQRLALVFGLNVALVAALVIVGVTAHSLGVLAAGVDYLADAAAIAVSLFAIRLVARSQRLDRGGCDQAPGVGRPRSARAAGADC